MTWVTIGGMHFNIEKFDNDLDVCHSKSGAKLYGQISYEKQSIRIWNSTPERELRSILHEILHGIINEYRIRELMDDKEQHLEFPIDQLSLGLAEVLESVGIKSLALKEENANT